MLTVNGYLNSLHVYFQENPWFLQLWDLHNILNLKICSLSLSAIAPEIPTRVGFTIIRADWLKNADVAEVVSQLGIADDIFSVGETRKSRQRRLLSQARSFKKNNND